MIGEPSGSLIPSASANDVAPWTIGPPVRDDLIYQQLTKCKLGGVEGLLVSYEFYVHKKKIHFWGPYMYEGLH